MKTMSVHRVWCVALCAGDPDCVSDDTIKSEPMYLGEGEGYVNDTYSQVLRLEAVTLNI